MYSQNQGGATYLPTVVCTLPVQCGVLPPSIGCQPNTSTIVTTAAQAQLPTLPPVCGIFPPSIGCPPNTSTIVTTGAQGAPNTSTIVTTAANPQTITLPVQCGVLPPSFGCPPNQGPIQSTIVTTAAQAQTLLTAVPCTGVQTQVCGGTTDKFSTIVTAGGANCTGVHTAPVACDPNTVGNAQVVTFGPYCTTAAPDVAGAQTLLTAPPHCTGIPTNSTIVTAGGANCTGVYTHGGDKFSTIVTAGGANCTGVHTNGCGPSTSTIVTYGCNDGGAQTLLTAGGANCTGVHTAPDACGERFTVGPNCTGIHTNGCGPSTSTIVTYGCNNGGAQTVILTAPPHCTGIYTNGCGDNGNKYSTIVTAYCPNTSHLATTFTGAPGCTNVPTTSTLVTTEGAKAQTLLTAPPHCGGIYTNGGDKFSTIVTAGGANCTGVHTAPAACGVLLTAPPHCTGIPTNGCHGEAQSPATYTDALCPTIYTCPPAAQTAGSTITTTLHPTYYNCQPTVTTTVRPSFVCPPNGGGAQVPLTMITQCTTCPVTLAGEQCPPPNAGAAAQAVSHVVTGCNGLDCTMAKACP